MPHPIIGLRAPVIAMSALALTSACASGPGSHTTPSQAASRPSADVITAADIARAGRADETAYDAVRRLRPSFLSYHGFSGSPASAGQPLVTIDGGALSSAQTLGRVKANEVQEMRYLSAANAATRFGTSANSSPVIVVQRR